MDKSTLDEILGKYGFREVSELDIGYPYIYESEYGDIIVIKKKEIIIYDAVRNKEYVFPRKKFKKIIRDDGKRLVIDLGDAVIEYVLVKPYLP